MKNKKNEKLLKLKKESIRKLDVNDLNKVIGGGSSCLPPPPSPS